MAQPGRRPDPCPVPGPRPSPPSPLVVVSKTKDRNGNVECLYPLRRSRSGTCKMVSGSCSARLSVCVSVSKGARVCGARGVRCVCARLREGLAAAGAGTDSPGRALAAPHTKPLASPLTPTPPTPLSSHPTSPAPSKLSDWSMGQKFLWRRLGADVTGRIVPFRDPGGSAHAAGCRLEAGGGSSGPGGSQVAERSTQHPGGGTTPAGFPWRFLWV